MRTKSKPPEIQINVTKTGLKAIKVFADSASDRDSALKTILQVSPELRALEAALARGKAAEAGAEGREQEEV
jgi:hypothetical protein